MTAAPPRRTALTLLEHPQAQNLLQDAILHPADLAACSRRLHQFVQRYLPRFFRAQQRRHAETILQGKLTGLQRKTTEPIAPQAGLQRRPLQLFVGAGQWDDPAVLGQLRRHVGEELADDDATFVLDGSGFPKQGAASCGVARQWCGRLGKVENGQVGVFLASVAPRGGALVDAGLYQPQEWATDRPRRVATFVPAAVNFREKWRIGLERLDRVRQELPGRWGVGDDELGRCTAWRGQWRLRQVRYVWDVPCNTLVRDLSQRRPPARPQGKPRRPLLERGDHWVQRQPNGRWRTVTRRDGTKGP